MKQFVNRHAEMDALRAEYLSDDASFVVVYGRRRVGKTALLANFIKDKPALYYLATEESAAQNLDVFRMQVADFIHDEFMRGSRVSRWEPVFEQLARFADASPERVVIVIDEFQYLGKSDPAFPSVFQRIWDTVLSSSNVMLVICGSLVTMMESQALVESSPLYGRCTARMRIRPIAFAHYAEFFDAPLSERQLVERYGITGGIPKYVELFRGRDGLYRLIEKNILNNNSFLFDEPNFLLSKEVSEVGNYFSIMRAISGGCHRISDIASRLEVKATSLSKYLDVLEKLDLVERQVPVTEPNPAKSKKGLYFICDNYMRFWFRFVFPSMGLLESGHPEPVLDKIRRNYIDTAASFAYEDICRDRLWTLGAKGVLPFVPEKVGRWWGAGDTEIDAVALSEEEGAIAFGECKFWRKLVGANVLHDLEEKTTRVPWRRDERREYFVLFSISGYTAELQTIARRRNDVILA